MVLVRKNMDTHTHTLRLSRYSSTGLHPALHQQEHRPEGQRDHAHEKPHHPTEAHLPRVFRVNWCSSSRLEPPWCPLTGLKVFLDDTPKLNRENMAASFQLRCLLCCTESFSTHQFPFVCWRRFFLLDLSPPEHSWKDVLTELILA